MKRIIDLLKNDFHRMTLLKVVANLDLPDCYIAAGFVRNMVWDALHNYPMTPLNDIDVIFFNPDDITGRICKSAEQSLHSVMPDINWQVKNQAIMHIRNGDTAYTSSTDAMSFWPEKETAPGVRLNSNGSIEVASPFGIESLLKGHITYNPKREKALFLERVISKKWLSQWPNLDIIMNINDQ